MLSSLIFLSTIFVQLTAGLSEQRGLGTHTISLTRSAPDQPLGGGPVDYDRIEAHLDALEAKYSNVLHKRGKARRDGHKRAKSSAALTLVENGSAWAAPATFGGAPVSFILDTAFSDCLVSEQVYDPRKSKTARRTTAHFGFDYNSRPAGGDVWRDTLEIAGLSVPSVAAGVSTQPFLSQAGGVCGLGPDGSSAFNAQFHPFFYQMVSSHLVTKPQFAFALSKSGASDVTFGGTNPAHFSGALTSVKVKDPVGGFWKLPGSLSGVNAEFILDSASDLIVVPKSNIRPYFTKLGVTPFTRNGVVYGSYPCSKPPSLVFKFGDAVFPVIESAKSLGHTDDGQCILAMVGKDVGLAVPTVGAPLFESSYIVFDIHALDVAFAQRK
ncbi:hypothetical protein OC861_005774 [Tilletia horrida]|nr:hypothetical protein OC861_005774 [Tilletia horrida]